MYFSIFIPNISILRCAYSTCRFLVHLILSTCNFNGGGGGGVLVQGEVGSRNDAGVFELGLWGGNFATRSGQHVIKGILAGLPPQSYPPQQ